MRLSPRRLFLLGLRLAFSAGILWWLLRSLDAAATWRVIRAARWSFCLAAVACLAVDRLLTAWKWQGLLAAQGGAYPYGPLLRSVWTSNFLGQFLPTTAGSDGMRLYTFNRLGGRPLQGAASLVMERLTGAVSLALLAFCGALWSWVRWGSSDMAKVVVVPVAAILAAAGILWHPATEWYGRAWIQRLPERLGRAWVAQAYEVVLRYRRQPAVTFVAMALSLLTHLSRVLAVAFTAHAVGITSVNLRAWLVIVPSVLLVSMLPISIGGWGVREGAFVFLSRLAGIHANLSLSLALLWRALGVAGDAPGLMWFLRGGLGRHTKGSAAQPAAAPERPAHA